MKYFNTAGPCEPSIHYMVPAEQRLPEARTLAERGFYFVVHAPRQTGKTTVLRSLARTLTAEGRFTALHFSCETAEPAQDNYEGAQRAVLSQIRFSAEHYLPPELRPPAPWPAAAPESMLTAGLSAWASASPRPLVLFFDEIDALRGESLLSVLRQIRAGYSVRPTSFPHAVVLCGLRDVRDYKAASGGDPSRLGTSSPFNIKVESLRLGDFSEDETVALLGQHTAETGQPFTGEALRHAFALSAGQPWLVNALGREVTERMGLPPDAPITVDHLEQAKERLILARATHLDSLVARLHEPRVKRLLEPLLAGDMLIGSSYDDDVHYLRDLGLAAPTAPLRVANPIYREVLVRVLAGVASDSIVLPHRHWVRADGSLDLPLLLTSFADFWREQGSLIAASMPYHEVAAQIVLMAWIQRIVNGGGFVDREYGVGRRRIDLLVRWPLPSGAWQREALELKMHRDGEPDPTPAGLRQIEDYLESLGLETGTLVVFDRRNDAPPVEQRTVIESATTPRRGLSVRLLRA